MKTHRGLVLGNSHAAMLIKALRDNPTGYPALDLAFLTQAGDGPRDLMFSPFHIQAVDAGLVAFLKKTGCATEYDLKSFDFIVVVGCGVNLYRVLKILNSHHIIGLASSRQAAKNQTISQGCFRALIQDTIHRSLAIQLVKNLRAICPLPIIIIPQPLRAETLANATDQGGLFRRVTRNQNGAAVYQAFLDGLNIVAQGFSDVTVIAQPQTTIKRHIYTKLEYTAGATTLHNVDKPQPSDDTLHANAKYGALILETLNRRFHKHTG